MRQSRRAGLAARYVRYDKYACKRTQVPSGKSCYQTEWVTVDSGTDPNIYLQGITSYEIVFDGGQYVYASAGEQSSVSAAEPGTVYDCFGDTMTMMTVSSSGYYLVRNRKVVTQTIYRDVYTAGALLGSVLASAGKYPEAEKYTYVTTNGANIIMKDSGGNYFAYRQTDGGA